MQWRLMPSIFTPFDQIHHYQRITVFLSQLPINAEVILTRKKIT